MKIDVTVPMQLPVSRQLQFIQRAEDFGIDGAGLADHMEHGRDVFSILAMALMQTRTIALFPCVTNPITRHPWVLANIAHAFEEQAPGRFRLAIGAGDSAVLHIGRRPARVKELHAAVSGIRALLQGQAVDFGDAKEERIIGIEGTQPPVIVAAGGPRVTELAGEAGDEALLLTGFDDRILAMVRRHLQAGASRSGRSLAGFGLSHYTLVRIEDDAESALEFGRSRLETWLRQGFFRTSLEELGFDPAIAMESMGKDDLRRLIDAMFLVGPAGRIAERLQSLSSSGSLDRMICVLSSANGPDAALDAFAGEVLPRLK